MAVEESPNAFSVEWNPTIFSSNCQTSSSSHIQVNPREEGRLVSRSSKWSEDPEWKPTIQKAEGGHGFWKT